MLDKVISSADWVTPLWAMVQDIANAGGHTFLMPVEYFPYAPLVVQQFLESKGIRTYGLMVVDGYVMISCHPNKAQWAQYWLDQLGLWIEYGRV